MYFQSQAHAKQVRTAEQGTMRLGDLFRACNPDDHPKLLDTMLTSVGAVVAGLTASGRPAFVQEQVIDNALRVSHSDGIPVSAAWKARQAAVVSADQALLTKQRASAKTTRTNKAKEAAFRAAWEAEQARRNRDDNGNATDPSLKSSPDGEDGGGAGPNGAGSGAAQQDDDSCADY